MKTVLAILLVACAALTGTVHAQITFRAAASAGIDSNIGTVTFVGSGTALGQGTQVTLTLPAAAQTGDVVIAVVAVEDETNASVTKPGTFTLIRGDNAGNHTQITSYRVIIGADTPGTTTYTWSWAGTEDYAAALLVFRGVDTATPINAHNATATNATNTTTINIPAVTPTVADTLLVAAVSIRSGSTFGTWSGGLTERTDVRSAAGGDEVGTGSATVAGPAAGVSSGAFTVTASDNDTSRVGALLALRPASVGLTINVPAGTVAGDVMIASIAARPCSGTNGGACTTTMIPPAGWTLVNSFNQTGGGGTGGWGNVLYVYRRVATGAEPVAYNWNVGGTPVNNGAVGGLLSFSGVDTTNPIVIDAGQTTPVAATHATPSVNTGTVTNTMLVGSFAANSSASWAPPGGMTEVVDVPSMPVPNDLGLSIAMTYEARAAAGATGTRTATQSTPPVNDTGATHLLALRPAVTVQHYSISALSTTVANCDYAEVTITAHNAAHVAVNPPASRIVTLSVSAGAATAVWQPALVAGSGAWAPAGATATYLWPGGESIFTVRLRQSAVIGLTVNANDTFVSEAGIEDPAISFVNSVFRISDGANAPRSINTQIAGKASNAGFGTQSLFLQAIRTDTVTGACTSLFPSGAEVDIGVGAQCNNPATCTQNVTLTTTSGSGSPTGSFVPAGAGTYPATIRFRFTTAFAEAPFYFSYPDAGQITLQFRRVTAAPAVTIAGTSNAFVVRPFAMYTQVTGNPGANTPSGTVFTSAGSNFSASVNAVAWQAADDANNDGIPDSGANLSNNATTPNFAYATTLTAAAPYEPASGTLGALNNGNLAAGAFSLGQANPANLRYTEVGSFSLATAVTDYLGDANADVASLALVVGRFTPQQFAVVKNIPRFEPACVSGQFSYIGQSFGYESGQQPVATVTALNALGGTTRNYTGAWRRLTNTTLTPATQLTRYAAFAGALDPSTLPSVAGDPAIADLTGASLGSFTLTFSSTGGLRFTRTNPVAPFDADIGLSINVIDADGIAYSANPLTFGAATAGNGIAFAGGGSPKQMRFGRLRLNNAFGSSLLDLPLALSIQYYNGSFFVTNGADSCTTLAASDIAFSFVGPNLAACDTFLNPGGALGFTSGSVNVRLTKPGGTKNGAVDLTVNLGAVASGNTCTSATSSAATAANKTWLQGNWGTGTYTDNPRGRATFGIFKSADQMLYLREVY